MPPPRATEKWPLDPRGYKPGYVEARASRARTDGAPPPHAVLRIYGHCYALSMPFLPEYKKRAMEAARVIVREIERGTRPDPRRRVTAADIARTVAPSLTTFAESQRIFFQRKVAMSPEEAADPIVVRRRGTIAAQYRAALRAVFPADNYLNDTTLATCVEAWNDEPLGAEKLVVDRVSGERSRTREHLTTQGAGLYKIRARAYIKFCIAKRWISVDPFDGLGEPRGRKKLAPKLKQLTRSERRALMRFIVAESRATNAKRFFREDLSQFADFARILGLSGMRISEASTVRLASYATDPSRENYLTHDAIVLNETKTTKIDRLSAPRIIPLAHFPFLRNALDRQRRHAARHDGYLFSWHTPARWQRVRIRLRECFDRAGMTQRIDPAHIFRAVADAYYEEMLIPQRVRVLLLGHSEEVNTKNYSDTERLRFGARAKIDEELIAVFGGGNQSVTNRTGPNGPERADIIPLNGEIPQQTA